MDTQVSPPPIEELVEALRPLVKRGLPVTPSLEDGRLLGLRGVVARAIDPLDRLNRVKAFDDLLTRLVALYPNDELGEAARVLFAVAPGYRGTTLTLRREAAARTAEITPDHFRKHVELEIITTVGWQLHRDSQNYIPRGRELPPPLNSNGDTPTLRVGDISSKDAAEHEELLSRLWAHVYALRAEILRVERLKVWPYDPTEPSLSERKFNRALDSRTREVEAVKVLVRAYVDRYGQRIAHGDAEFSADSLLRLAGWESNQ